MDSEEYKSTSNEEIALDILTDFINVPTLEIDTAIELALKRIGEKLGVDRSYVFLMNRDLSRMSNTHEWCADSIESHKQRLQELSTDVFPYITGKLKRYETFRIPRVRQLPLEAAAEREEFELQKIQSLLDVPMIAEGRLIGFVGVDTVHSERDWSDEDVALLMLMADIFSSVLGRKKSDVALRESEETARALLDASDDPALLMDHDGTLLALNRSAAEQWKRTREELIGKTIQQLFPPELVKSRGDYFRQVLKTCESARYEERYLGRAWRVSVHPVKNQEGRIRRVAMFARDITVQKEEEADRERQEEHLLQSQKLEAIGTMAGGVAHDFNNLLTGILGNINMAQLDGSDSVQGFLKKAEMAAVRAATLVNQLLTFSRKSQSEFQVLYPAEVIEELCAMMRQTIDRRISIDGECCEDTWPIYADPGQIHQVLMNLCINSRDAIMDILEEREAGNYEAEMDSYRIQVGLENKVLTPSECKRIPDASPGRYVRFFVSDNGPGMEEEVRKRIFEPFYSTKEQGRGTGLGLSTAFGIVKQHKGWFEVESRLGEGSTFAFYVPIQEGEFSREIEDSPDISFIPDGQTILLVDDERLVRDLGEAILGRLGYNVLLAENGKQGLEMYLEEKDRIDLVILDLTMPYLSGKEVLQQVLQHVPKQRVLMSSGFVNSDQEKEFMDLGAVGFVAKPYSINEMTEKVKAALS